MPYLLASDFGFLFRQLCFLWPFLLLGLLFGLMAAYFHWYRSARHLRVEAETENTRLREGLMISKRAAPALQKQRLVAKQLGVAVSEGKVLKNHIQRVAAKVEQRDRELASTSTKLASREQEVVAQRNKYQESQVAVRMLTDSINERNSEILGLEANFKNERSQHGAELGQLKTLLQEQDQGYTADAKAASTELETLQAAQVRLEKRLEEEARVKEALTVEATKVKSERDQTVQNLQKKAAELEAQRLKYETGLKTAESSGVTQQQEVADLKKRLADGQQATRVAESNLTKLRQDQVTKDKEIAALKVTEGAKSDDIELLLAELEVLESSAVKKAESIKPLEGLLAERDAEILSLKSKLGSEQKSPAVNAPVRASMPVGLASFAGEDVEVKEGLGVVYRSRPGKVDDLTRIKGIGNVIEKKLHGFGVYRFKQIVAWAPETVDKFSEQLDFKGRIEREEWQRQARELDA